MPHDHSHGHHAGHAHSHGEGLGDRALLWAVVINLGLTAAQVIGGLAADSTALVADGVHNLSDALALVLAFGARRLAARPASRSMTFGWGRAEIVAGRGSFIESFPLFGYDLQDYEALFEEKLALYGYVAITNETADCTSRVRSAWTNMISHRRRYHVPPSGDV